MDQPDCRVAALTLLTADPAQSTTATLVDDQGTDQTLCLVTDHTYHSTDTVYGPTGAAILQIDQAVLLIPAQPLAPTRYTATIHQPSKTRYNLVLLRRHDGSQPIDATSIQPIHVTDDAGATVFGNLYTAAAAHLIWDQVG